MTSQILKRRISNLDDIHWSFGRNSAISVAYFKAQTVGHVCVIAKLTKTTVPYKLYFFLLTFLTSVSC